jgi:hypothetical protein
VFLFGGNNGAVLRVLSYVLFRVFSGPTELVEDTTDSSEFCNILYCLQILQFNCQDCFVIIIVIVTIARFGVVYYYLIFVILKIRVYFW